MSTRWAVYPVKRKPDSTKWLVRWRVDGVARKRTFAQKGHADTWFRLLNSAAAQCLPADTRGWPVSQAIPQNAAPLPVPMGRTFEDYATTVWYPARKDSWADKNRLGHRGNMRFAASVLRYAPGDPRLAEHPDLNAGQSMLLRHIVPDDVVAAIVARRHANSRTTARNARIIDRALEAKQTEVVVPEASASAATVRAFYVTLGMVLKAARDSNHIPHDPLRGTAAHAPKSQRVARSQREVPSLQEVFDLADAIATLGPVGPDGRRLGERFRSLVLAAGTLGARPGELVAHHPDWFDWGTPTTISLRRSFTPVYDTEEGINVPSADGLRCLKHRQEGETRTVPVLPDVAEAIRLHMERGYSSQTRTWTSVRGQSLTWGNIMDTYWRPACQKVFGETQKRALVAMTPNTLRKAAVTFWLDSGIPPTTAAEWAGHSAEVAQHYYLGRGSTSYESELDLLATRAAVAAPGAAP